MAHRPFQSAWLGRLRMDILDYIYKRFDLKGDKESPIQLPGLRRQDFDKLLGHFELNEGCEIGVESGLHAKSMLDANPNLHLHLIDSYYYYKEMPRYSGRLEMEDYLAQMREKLSGCNYTEHIMFSMEAINEFEDESLDFVYIDGNHRFDFVIRDIIEWNRKVKIGGIIAGHDYKSRKCIGVNQAVDAYVEAHGIRPIFTTSKGRNYPDNTRTFFWVKE